MRLLHFSTSTKAKPMSTLQAFLKCPKCDSQELTGSSLHSLLFLIQHSYPQGGLHTSSLAPTTPQATPPYLWFSTPMAWSSHSGPEARMCPLCALSETLGSLHCTKGHKFCGNWSKVPLLFDIILIEVAKQFYLTFNENGSSVFTHIIFLPKTYSELMITDPRKIIGCHEF